MTPVVQSQRKRVAVIGGGVSGLGAAWALRETADVMLFEKAPRAGGHAWTVDVDYDGRTIPVDIGFICFNQPNYPNLTALLKTLGVRTHWTDMSFSVSDPENYEWSSDPFGLFAWKRNMVDPGFLSLISEILHFNNLARRQLIQGAIPEISLGDWLDMQGFSQTFRIAYLLPMSAAIWSTPEADMLDYPVASFIQFFDNHRLMHAIRPIWRTVAGGSRSYVDALVGDLGERVRPASQLRAVRPGHHSRIEIVEAGGAVHAFDDVILAAHANETLALLDPCYRDQRRALASIRFAPNTAWLHRDERLMPQRRTAWASWNVRKAADQRVCVTYWMNRLQKIPQDAPLFVTLNPAIEPTADKTFGVYEFDHPMYDASSALGRNAIHQLQGCDGLFFAGAWLGDGFHEAGLRSGLEAALALGGSVPWTPAIQHTLSADRPDRAREARLAAIG